MTINDFSPLGFLTNTFCNPLLAVSTQISSGSCSTHCRQQLLLVHSVSTLRSSGVTGSAYLSDLLGHIHIIDTSTIKLATSAWHE